MVLLLYYYNPLHSNNNCLRLNPLRNVQNLISLSLNPALEDPPVRSLSECRKSQTYTDGHNHSTGYEPGAVTVTQKNRTIE